MDAKNFKEKAKPYNDDVIEIDEDGNVRATGPASAVNLARITGVLIVHRHAAIYAPTVSKEKVNAICGALGDISIDEATAALDRLQKESDGSTIGR